jgi:glutamate synthase (NADPH/NADH) small chain
MEIPCQPMPEQDPAVRRGNMDEVALGYSDEQARKEAERCLQCRNAPCVKGCPVGIDIPGFIGEIAKGDNPAALRIIRESSLLPAICGRVCPQEKQCQAPCTVGKALKSTDQAVGIGRLERYVADWALENNAADVPEVNAESGRKVGVIGTGPAGLTVAMDLRREGHAVTLFEALHKPGGVLAYGIPEFRLPKAIVEREIDVLRAMGCTIETNSVVGRTRKAADLLEKDGFDALFVGAGAGLPRFMGIDGENLAGVYSANEYLTRSNLMRAYDRERAQTPISKSRTVAVIGGGNVAMDAARTALRLGAEEVHLMYRRTKADMPARREEVHHAEEEGVQFHFLMNPTRILPGEQGRVGAIECLRYESGEPDASGRCRPVAIDGSEEQLVVDTVIIAIGNSSNPLIQQTTPGLKTCSRGNIVVDGKSRSSVDRIYAGGDIVLGAATVILAMGEGRRAAKEINKILSTGE